MIEAALASQFSATLRLPLDAALALYGGMVEKSPGLTLTTKKRTPQYGGRINEIIAGQSVFVPSGYSMSADSLEAVAGFVQAAGITRVLEFGAGVTTIVLPKLLGGRLERYLSIEEDAAYAATLAPLLTGDAAYDKVTISQLQVDDEIGPKITRRDVGTFRAASFKGLREVVEETFGNAPPQLVLIDGPSGRARWGRFAALADIATLLPEGTCILLDDALRYREVAILDEWRTQELAEVEGIYCLGTGIGVARVM